MHDHEPLATMERASAEDSNMPPRSRLIFGVNDIPPIHITLFYGLQVTP